ncbi:LysM peptidoglycan-binding domain-containing protein [Ancylomarina sp. DW003]|nr:LysM peptidoglycan-binding domain-containing protein [Ancylomarina sp. DW003]MDE5422497.1 LysM peptidoglycan-binding domain-containing protein [Ancylomarina sp. DW003]
MPNNIKIKFYKKKDLVLLKRYKHATIIMSATCIALTLIIILELYNNKIIFNTKKTNSTYNNITLPNNQSQSQNSQNKIPYSSTTNLSPSYKSPSKTIKNTDHPKTKLFHIVQQGETIYSIANIYNVKINEIIQSNDIHNYIIHANDSLLILTNSP